VFGDLSDKGSATGVIYGFLRDILILRERFDTDRFIFCWDSGVSKRQKIYKQYKQNRKRREYKRAERKFNKEFRRQVAMLRDEYLHTIGYRNVFQQDGYESDDIIAAICKSLTPDLEEGVIVTADQDLLQLIRGNVSWYNPRTKEHMTAGRFKKIFKMHPRKWVKVKAIAGCTSDNVKGIVGVGEITAIHYILGELKKTTQAYKNIKTGWRKVVLRNRRLVELPFKGTKTPRLVKDKVTQKGWDEVTETLSMRSIRYR
jgi:DNA polymerase-1